jgi:tryptophan halogenase
MNIVIVGGGNSGWLTALLLAKSATHHQYTLISSSDISPIGVGEGTTGLFVNILDRPILGIDFDEMVNNINALPKLGIYFKNWSSNKNFYSPIEGSITNNYYIDSSTYVADLYDINHTASISGIAMKNCLSNCRKDQQKNEQSFFGSALHLDTFKTTEYLKTKCIQSGVKYINDKVCDVNVEEKKINSITLSNGTKITADLFIDCSGFHRVLSKHLTDWVSFEQYLPVNSAVVYEIEKELPKNPYTTATAMKYGWTWEIPTKERTGRGYVYCDKYTNEKKVINELKNYYGCKVEQKRKLNFTSGKSSDFLVGNCLIIGLSAAFLEPLQATSLHCTLVQVDDFLYSFLMSDSLNYQAGIDSYNKRCHQLYDTTKDFVFLHYTGGRTDTEFWKYFTECTYPENVKTILDFANQRLLRSYDLQFCAFPGGTSILWNSIIAGLGHYSKNLINTVLNNDHVDIKKYHQFLLNQEKELINILRPFQEFLD